MPKKILLGVLLVSVCIATAGLGYRFGRHLAQMENAGQAGVSSEQA